MDEDRLENMVINEVISCKMYNTVHFIEDILEISYSGGETKEEVWQFIHDHLKKAQACHSHGKTYGIKCPYFEDQVPLECHLIKKRARHLIKGRYEKVRRHIMPGTPAIGDE